jgi:hypothetical protein
LPERRERGPCQGPVQAQSPSAKRSIKTHAQDSTGQRPGEQADDQRARQLRRLAIIEAAQLAYGPAAVLGPTPPGPDICPPGCPWCLMPASDWGVTKAAGAGNTRNDPAEVAEAAA